MATDIPAEIRAADDRWRRMWSHREQLLKVARRRSMSPEDAEDAVHEAMLRAAERPELDDERLGAWLTTVTVRLCIDRYRQVSREAEVHRSPTLTAPGPVPVEEAVCDRAEARWLAVRSGELPARQAEALRLKSEDLDVGQVAVRMGLSYRTVESLLARARRTLRNSLAGTLGLALFLWGRGRLRAGGHIQAVAMTSTAATLVVAGCVLPYVHGADGRGAASRPPVSRTERAAAPETLRPNGAARTVTPQRGDTPTPGDTSKPADTPTATPSPSPDGHGRSPLALPVPSLPDASLAPVPSVPGVPGVPGASGLPRVPGLPDAPAASTVPTKLPPVPKAPVGAPTTPALP